MFYDAMLDLGVNERYAKILYWGVLTGGPRWQPTILMASSREDLSRQIQDLHASVINPSFNPTIEEPAEEQALNDLVEGRNGRFGALVNVLLTAPPLTQDDVNRFIENFDSREKQGIGMTAEEIESEAAFRWRTER